VHDLDKEAWRKLSLPAKVRLRWRLKARPKQLTPQKHALCTNTKERCEELMEEARARYPGRANRRKRDKWLAAVGHHDWFIWLILAGRGWGKTRTGAEDIVKYMLERPGARVALVAATFADGRDTMVEGESGILGILPKKLLLHWNRSIGELILTNGSRAKIFSAEEPERLRGPQHHRAWADELAAWKYLKKTWDQLMFGLRLEYRDGEVPQVIITTTPKPLKFLREQIVKSANLRKGIIVTRGNTFENAVNLARNTLEQLKETYAGTRMGRQELNAEILEDYEGSVIKQSDIDAARVEIWQVPNLEDLLGLTAVGVDPAVTANKQSDETGIVAAGMSQGACPICTREQNPRGRPHAFILEDATPGRVSDHEWAAVAARTYRKWRCGRVVAEVNNGGDLVESVLIAALATMPVKKVRASKGKVIRAEPIGALFERHAVHMVGEMPKLEQQLCSLGSMEEDDESEAGEDESKSPDRADACVWVLTDLFGLDDSQPIVIASARDDRGVGSR
jgi:phage terminase large subunit-like protein